MVALGPVASMHGNAELGSGEASIKRIHTAVRRLQMNKAMGIRIIPYMLVASVRQSRGLHINFFSYVGTYILC